MDNKSDMSKEQEVRLDAEISSYNNDSTQESAAIGGNKSCEWYEKKVKEAAEAGLERIENSDEDKDMDKVCRKPSLIELENELLKNASNTSLKICQKARKVEFPISTHSRGYY